MSPRCGTCLPGTARQPENVFGKLSIVNNQISVSGAADEGMGIMIVSVAIWKSPWR